MTLYDKIKNMTVDEMASFLLSIIDCSKCPRNPFCETFSKSCLTQLYYWLSHEESNGEE